MSKNAMLHGQRQIVMLPRKIPPTSAVAATAFNAIGGVATTAWHMVHPACSLSSPLLLVPPSLLIINSPMLEGSLEDVHAPRPCLFSRNTFLKPVKSRLLGPIIAHTTRL